MGPNKKRKVTQVEEITFDSAARQQFLTGFRKRKQARVRHAQEVAEKRYREDRIDQRKRIREERKAEYERAFEEHQRQLKLLNENSDNEADKDAGEQSNGDDDEEFEGFEDPPAVDYEAEYIDEDKYTTVTVEGMDPSREGLLRSAQREGSDVGSDREEGGQTEHKEQADESHKPAAKKKALSADKPKKKKKKFRYESKEDRKVNLAKQRLSKAKKAKVRRGE